MTLTIQKSILLVLLMFGYFLKNDLVVPWSLFTSWACLENESALAIMAAVLSSASPSFCPLSSNAKRARARSPTMPDAAPFMPSIPPGPGMCWARLRGAFPAPVSPTETKLQSVKKVLQNFFNWAQYAALKNTTHGKNREVQYKGQRG